MLEEKEALLRLKEEEIAVQKDQIASLKAELDSESQKFNEVWEKLQSLVCPQQFIYARNSNLENLRKGNSCRIKR